VSNGIINGAWEAVTMKVDRKRVKNLFVVAVAALAFLAGMAYVLPSAYAGGTIKLDDDKWISLGMGTRLSFNMVEDGSGSGGQASNTFGVNNARIYINGKIHKYVGFEFNTECFNCTAGAGNGNGSGGSAFGANSEIGILDAIGKFEITETANVWFGRMLVPTERGELNGPFYHAVFDGFRTPFNQSDFSGNFGTNGAGLYGRDNGVTFFGKVHPGGTHLQYVGGIFTGLQSGGSTCNLPQLTPTAGGTVLTPAAYGGPCGANQRNQLKYAGRLTLNLLNEEKNPGYYTSGTYYGTAGDILALAVGGEYQNSGAGTYLNSSYYGNITTDLLYEKVLGNNSGVVTVNAEFKRYWAQNQAAFTDASSNSGGCFCMFGGTAWTGYVLYLFPQEIGIGRFQPYGRYTGQNGEYSGVREEFELGLNYVIAGHNARISTYWRNGNIGGTSTYNGQVTNYAPGSTGQHIDTWVMALQLQY
jgi:hypothetical protein